MKIQIIGGSATGKSTLAKYISEQANIKWIDTDAYLWQDSNFTHNHPLEKRLELYQKDITTYSDYVVSGSVFSWCPQGFGNRDLLVFLCLDEVLRMQRLITREIERNGVDALQHDESWQYTNDFLEWCKTYLTQKSPTMAGTYAEHTYQMVISQSPVLKLDAAQEIKVLYLQVLKALPEEKS